MDKCPKCGGTDLYTEKSGRVRCRPCQNERMRKIYATPEYKAKHREDDRKRRRNMPPERFNELVELQKGNCAICGKHVGDRLLADHDHENGNPRGLLCNSCNCGLGNFKDDPKLLETAIQYLKLYA